MSNKRAPVQADWQGPRYIRTAGTISWEEHLMVYAAYAAKYGRSQSAERIAERGGFGYGECCKFLGYEPMTWEPVDVRSKEAGI